MSQFTTIPLSNERVLVKGTDRFGTSGETVLDGSAWAEVKRHRAYHEATDGFDAAVEEFFAPLMEAADKLEQAISLPKPDPDTYVVLSEGVEGTPGKEAEVIKLGPDSVVLRLIERGDTDRLVWVMDRLEVMAVVPAAAPSVSHEDYVPADLEGGPADDAPIEG